ncbi:MAG: serine hydrolase domain-containing protein [Promethearchaeota archaeon]
MIKENIIQEINQLFKPWDKLDSPGCVLGIIKDGKFIYKKGYGMADLEHNIPISSESVFCIGSVTKQFIAICILLLTEQNKLCLDDDIRNFLPRFPNYNQTITVRNLIHHTSGIRDFSELLLISGKNYLDDTTRREAMSIILKQKQLNFAPGEEMLYGNSNYLLLIAIIENITGKPIRKFADENIFMPLKMKNTYIIEDSKLIIKNRAFDYNPNIEGQYINVFRTSIGLSVVYSNLDDLFLWDQNYYNNKLGNSGQNLIKSMLTPYRLNNGTEGGYAFGVGVDIYKGDKRVWHNGYIGGYRSQYISFPECRFSVIILTNSSNLHPEPLADKIADMVLKIKPKEFESLEILIDPEIFNKYNGKYLSESLGMVKISTVKDCLIFQGLSFPRTELIAESESSFFLKGFKVRISFEKAGNNSVSQYVLHQQGMGIDEIYQKIEPSTLSQEELNHYVGKYYSEETNSTYKILIRNNGLYLGYQGNYELEFLEKNKFQITQTVRLLFKFKRIDNEIIEGFELDTRRLRNLWFTKIN